MDLNIVEKLINLNNYILNSETCILYSYSTQREIFQAFICFNLDDLVDWVYEFHFFNLII